MGPAALAQVLRPLADMFPADAYPEVIRGLQHPDDAAVYRLDDDQAIVLTADFFPPVIDDPYHFGAIAAANSLSDLYAMGARPLFGINLVGFPETLDPAILSEILRGGGEKVRESGAVVVGGHTTTDREPKYGLAVAGLVHPERVLKKGGARPGDVLLLTKPLGTGTITTAHKQGVDDPADLEAAIASMERLNGPASAILHDFGDAVRALTDITGFGLVGHGHEMAHQSGLTLRFRIDDLPLLPGARRYAEEDRRPGGGGRNAQHYGTFVRIDRPVDDALEYLIYDPQTSGGLLAAVAPDRVESILDRFRDAGEDVWRIGDALDDVAGGIRVV